MEDYLEATNEQFALVDVGLHMSFFNASHQGKDFDLTHIFEGSLVASRPDLAITFVENHDTQRGQALESTVEDWFKPLAYGNSLAPRRQTLSVLWRLLWYFRRLCSS